MPEEMTVYWGDSHHNSYQHYVQDPPLEEILGWCGKYLDFYTGAYYTPAFANAPVLPGVRAPVSNLEGGHLSEQDAASGSGFRGVHLEGLKDPDALEREWREFRAATRAANRPGRFVAFPGYEWQGNGRWGDANVIFRTEEHPLFLPETIRELYDALRGIDAIAIPHHTGYFVGQRAPRWEFCDDAVSPFAEVFSIHGCSETDEEWVGLRHNSHMGPGTGGGTYRDALLRGLRLGAVCSTDNWTNMPGHWGHGLMACLAPELTRDALWDAFRERRVYGVTGDRIAVDFTCNGRPMGSILDPVSVRELEIRVAGWDAIDRIELLRNERVIATHCHQDTWAAPVPGRKTRFRIRVEAGWGPRPNEIPLGDREWAGEMRIAGGRFLSWSPAWVTRGQGVPMLAGDRAEFRLVSRQAYVGRETQGATLLEFEADPAAPLCLRLHGEEIGGSVADFAARSRLIWYRDDCVRRIREATGVTPETARRGDVYYQMACKAKVHRAIPEAGYTAELTVRDDERLPGETWYRVRVEQRNGQRAWSSPIWVREA